MKEELSTKTRTESDLIGSREIPESAMYGVQTLRGIENFRISKFHLNEYPLPLPKWEQPLPIPNLVCLPGSKRMLSLKPVRRYSKASTTSSSR